MLFGPGSHPFCGCRSFLNCRDSFENWGNFGTKTCGNMRLAYSARWPQRILVAEWRTTRNWNQRNFRTKALTEKRKIIQFSFQGGNNPFNRPNIFHLAIFLDAEK